MMKNVFQEMGLIYESGYRDNGLDYGGNYKYVPSTDLKNSYSGKGQLPTGTPGNAGNAYSFNSTHTTFEDEEGPTGSISKKEISVKINELLDDANEKGMSYAIEQLYELLQFINK